MYTCLIQQFLRACHLHINSFISTNRDLRVSGDVSGAVELKCSYILLEDRAWTSNLSEFPAEVFSEQMLNKELQEQCLWLFHNVELKKCPWVLWTQVEANHTTTIN